MEISKNTYEMISEDFSATRNRVWPEMEILVKKYVRSGMKVLDLGCGNGRLAGILPEVRYIGVDGCEMLAEKAKKIYDLRFKNYEFKILDMLELEKLGEKDFDVVFMFASLNHVASEKNRRKVLEDVKNILKPGGILIMTNWNMWRIGAGKGVWRYKLKIPSTKSKIKNYGLGFRDVMTVWQSGDKKKQGELYYRAFGLKELKGLLDKTGFVMMENYYSLEGEKAQWWKGKNIVTVGRSVGE